MERTHSDEEGYVRGNRHLPRQWLTKICRRICCFHERSVHQIFLQNHLAAVQTRADQSTGGVHDRRAEAVP